MKSDIQFGLTFDDLLLKPSRSQVLPHEVTTVAKLTSKIALNIPLVSAAMDTVTEANTAIAMARHGGLGFIHKNISIEHQVLEALKVKKSESGMIIDPITVGPDNTIYQVLDLMKQYRVSGVPVVVGDRKLVGIITNRDLRFETNFDQKVSDVMTKENLITVREGITLEESKAVLHKHRIEKLLVTEEDGTLKGLITIKDIEKVRKYPLAAKDGLGRLRAGAAIGVGEEGLRRAERLLAAGVDVLCLDSAHGHSQRVLDSVKELKRNWPDAQVVAGNVATPPGSQGSHRRGRRLRQGRRGPRLHLHHPGGGRRGACPR